MFEVNSPGRRSSGSEFQTVVRTRLTNVLCCGEHVQQTVGDVLRHVAYRSGYTNPIRQKKASEKRNPN